jgi:hypothetical protein
MSIHGYATSDKDLRLFGCGGEGKIYLSIVSLTPLFVD